MNDKMVENYNKINYLEIHAVYDDGSRNIAETKNIDSGKYLLDMWLDNEDITSIIIFKTRQVTKILQE